MKIKETPEKYCQYCGKKLERKRLPNGDLEYFIHFNKRKYCDRECMKRAFLKSGKSNQDWSSAHHTARKINELILHKEVCEKCGSRTNLDVHHKDFNSSNNAYENLQVLCRSCHMKIHRSKPICSVKSCNNAVKGHGLCEKHLQRWRKYGDPMILNKGHGHLVRENFEQAGNGVTVAVVEDIARAINTTE